VLCDVRCVRAKNTKLFDMGSYENGLRRGSQLGDSASHSSMNEGNDFVDGKHLTVPHTFINKTVSFEVNKKKQSKLQPCFF
jgi:hypothetical protein